MAQIQQLVIPTIANGDIFVNFLRSMIFFKRNINLFQCGAWIDCPVHMLSTKLKKIHFSFFCLLGGGLFVCASLDYRVFQCQFYATLLCCIKWMYTYLPCLYISPNFRVSYLWWTVATSSLLASPPFSRRFYRFWAVQTKESEKLRLVSQVIRSGDLPRLVRLNRFQEKKCVWWQYTFNRVMPTKC